MRITQGTVVGGKIVVQDEPLKEGSTVTVLVPHSSGKQPAAVSSRRAQAPTAATS